MYIFCKVFADFFLDMMLVEYKEKKRTAKKNYVWEKRKIQMLTRKKIDSESVLDLGVSPYKIEISVSVISF